MHIRQGELEVFWHEDEDLENVYIMHIIRRMPGVEWYDQPRDSYPMPRAWQPASG